MKPSYEELEAQVKQLAAENAVLKSKGRELLGEACAVYAKLNKLIDPAIGDFIDGQTLHEFQFVLDVETKETDAILASLRAEGVESGISRIMTIMNHQHPDVSKVINVLSMHAEELRWKSEQVKGVQS